MRRYSLLPLIALALLVSGCSVEPKHGTRVVFAFPHGTKITRQQVLDISKYLKTKGELVLNVQGPRVDSVNAHTLTLLLPGKKFDRQDVDKLIAPASIELFHLINVSTKTHPNRPWKLIVPSSRKAPYIFVGANSQRIESRKNSKELLSEVVGYPKVKPVLTGANILPTAFVQEMQQGWAVQVKFSDTGARILRDFTRRNVGEYLAVFYNGYLISAPVIKERIPTGDARITGFATQSLARAAVSDLNAGSLPTKVKITRLEHY